MKDALVFTGIVLGVLGFIVGVTIGMVALAKYFSSVACKSYSKETNRETRFAVYAFGAYGCLTPSQDGKWIDINYLRDIK